VKNDAKRAKCILEGQGANAHSQCLFCCIQIEFV
jgi:hypothetical protein